MVWLSKWIKENISDSRILIITDRDELDVQISRCLPGSMRALSVFAGEAN